MPFSDETLIETLIVRDFSLQIHLTVSTGKVNRSAWIVLIGSEDDVRMIGGQATRSRDACFDYLQVSIQKRIYDH